MKHFSGIIENTVVLTIFVYYMLLEATVEHVQVEHSLNHVQHDFHNDFVAFHHND